MKILANYFLIFLVFSQFIFAAESKYFQDKFNTSKKFYLGSIMSNNKTKEIEYLKELIKYGEKLHLDTLSYKRELNRIDTMSIIKNQTKSVLKNKYTIKSVTQSQNTISINFDQQINSTYIDFTESKKGNLYQDEFLLKGNFKNAYPTKLSMDSVDKISIYQKENNILSIIFTNKRNLKTIYIINRKQIVIKVLDIQGHSKQKNKNIIDKVKVLDYNILYPSKKVIVIDPGHGGRDPGASYKGIRHEKNITLGLSKYLKKDLEKLGFKVYLTRTKDKYIKLSQRTKFANTKNADFFISIHANAAKKSRANKAHGIESYFLSPARSARAKRVAALENKGDMSGMGWSSKDSLLTILNRGNITAANKMAIDIQKNMLFTLRNRYGKKIIRDGGVREGPFWVLVGAQMPSVLVEVGYISHPQEGRRIATSSYQKLIASGIAKGIQSYFIKN